MKQNYFTKRIIINSLLFTLFCLALSGQSYAQGQETMLLEKNKGPTKVYYVTTTGSDTADGLNWATAFETIQHAINTAYADTAEAEVWVAQGTYSPTECLSDADGLQTGNEYKSFIMYAGVDVYGGFYGDETTKDIGVTGGRQLGASNEPWDFANPTILNGNDTSYHVVWFGSNGFIPFTYSGIQIQIPNTLDEPSIMNGFTIKNGNANHDIRFENTTAAKKEFVHTAGAGVSVIGKGELHNCIVKENMAKYGGAGIGMFNGAKVENCLVSDNEAIGVNFYSDFLTPPYLLNFDYWRTDGAGIMSAGSDTSFCIIEGSKIDNNLGRANDNYPNTPSSANDKVNNGGGVYLVYTLMTNTHISSNNILNNPDPYDGNSGASCGGGVYMYKNAVVDNCEITDNGFLTTSQNGAGVFIADYTEEATSYDDLVLTNCFVHSNRTGAAILSDAQYSSILNTVVANNDGIGIGGYGNCTRSQTVNCLIYNNESIGYYQSANSGNSLNSIINSTVVNNGTGVSINNTNNHSVSNCIVWGNNSNPSTITTNPSVYNSAFSFTPPAGNGNFQIDASNAAGPQFENPTSTYGMNVSGWDTASWELQASSPCIDMGDETLVTPITSVDIEGNPRYLGCNVDLGAYESDHGVAELKFELNSNIIDDSFINNCNNSPLEFIHDTVVSGNYPFVVSWVFNNDPSSPLSGTDVSIDSTGQLLFDTVLTGGQYQLEITSIEDTNGCISPVTNLYADIFISPDFVVTQNNEILTATANNATYQWVDCDSNYTHIQGETDSVFVAQSNGNYAVIVEQNSCIDTSACFSVTNVNINNEFKNDIKIYPNPSDGQFVFENDKTSDLFVYSLRGSLLHQEHFEKGDHSLNLKHMEPGVYMIIVRSKKESQKHTIVIQ